VWKPSKAWFDYSTRPPNSRSPPGCRSSFSGKPWRGRDQPGVTDMRGLRGRDWPGCGPRSEEEVVDASIAAAQILIVSGDVVDINNFDQGAREAMNAAQHCGDVVRQARIAALHLLARAGAGGDVAPLDDWYRTTFAKAVRVGDGFARGVRSLALGRWLVGGARVQRPYSENPTTTAQAAAEHLQQAWRTLEMQGLEGWLLFTIIQTIKAHADLQQFDECERLAEHVNALLGRFPIFGSHAFEMSSQLLAMRGDRVGAADMLHAAIERAAESGLPVRLQHLMKQIS
jgi:hypothetical protein